MNTKLDFETIDMLSKGITQYVFRSGPNEEMQANYINLTRRCKFRLCSITTNSLSL